jgi:hypothetical protein
MFFSRLEPVGQTGEILKGAIRFRKFFLPGFRNRKKREFVFAARAEKRAAGTKRPL